MGYSNRNNENERLDNILGNFEDIFETGPMPLIISMLVCLVFNAIAMAMPDILKICFLVCGYIFLVFGIIKTFANYD